MDQNDNLERLSLFASNASLIEIRAWPKPGNVHRKHDFPNTNYGDFLKVAYNLHDLWADFLIKLNEEFDKGIYDLSSNYTSFLLKSVKKMMELQSGGNVLLGHLMLITPLFISSAYCMKKGIENKKEFWNTVNKLIQNSSPQETVVLYEAIRAANPGGMGSIEKYDIYGKNTLDQLINDNINLEKIFKLSKNYDSISYELATNYFFIRTEILPKMEKLIDEYTNNSKTINNLDRIFRKLSRKLLKTDLVEVSVEFNEFIVRIFLYILGCRPDTLIIRKNNSKIAEEISKKSGILFDNYYKVENSQWIADLEDFDDELHASEGKLNPGTSADLLTAAIFIKLLFNFLDF